MVLQDGHPREPIVSLGMTLPQTRPVTVPTERHAQLRALQQFLGAPNLSATLGELIQLFVHQHQLAPTVPGVSVHAVSDGVVLRIGDAAPVSLTPQTAGQFINGVRDVAAVRRKQMIASDAAFAIARMGQGIKIATYGDREAVPYGSVKAFGVDVALEVAALVEGALKGKA